MSKMKTGQAACKRRKNRKRLLSMEQLERRIVLTMVPLYDPIPLPKTLAGGLADDGRVVAVAATSSFDPAVVKVYEQKALHNATPVDKKLRIDSVSIVGDGFYGWLYDKSPTDVKLSRWDKDGVSVPLTFNVPNATSLDIHIGQSSLIVDRSGIATVLASARFADGSRKELIVRSNGVFADAPTVTNHALPFLIEGTDDGYILVGIGELTTSGRTYSKLSIYDPELANPQVLVTPSEPYELIKAAAIAPDGKTVAFVASPRPPEEFNAVYAVMVNGESKPTRLIGLARDEVLDVTESCVQARPSETLVDRSCPLETQIDLPYGDYFGSHTDILPRVMLSAIQRSDDLQSFYVGYSARGGTGESIFRLHVGIDEEGTDKEGRDFQVSAPDPVFIAKHTNPFGNEDGTEIDIQGNKSKSRILNAKLLDMNASGEILASVATSYTESSLVKTHFARRPVLVIPGIVGSFPDGDDFKDWISHVGYPAEKLFLDPIAETYSPLVAALEFSGYQKNKDLFEVAYDWRLAPAPRDGVSDGRITFPEVATYLNKVNSGTFKYGVDYLLYWLDKAQAKWESDHPGHKLETVDVIAHSTGGLLARAYAQSNIYHQATGAGGDSKLPKIGSFVMAAVPNYGAPKALSFLNDDWWIDQDPIYPYFLRSITNVAFQKILHDEAIELSGGSQITAASLLPAGQDAVQFITDYRANRLDPKSAAEFRKRFIDTYIKQIRGLVANDNFVIDNGTLVRPAPEFANEDLLDLNSGVGIGIFSDLYDFMSVVYGSGVPTAIQQKIRTGTSAQDGVDIMHLDQGFPADPIDGETYFVPIKVNEMIKVNDKGATRPLTGDGTVPRSSLGGSLEGSLGVNHKEYVSKEAETVVAGKTATSVEGKVDHIQLLSNPEVVADILKQLGHVIRPENVVPNNVLDTIYSWFKSGWTFVQIHVDPVRANVIDPLGRRLGVDSEGVLRMEIPDSLYYGHEDGIGITGGAEPGNWTIEINGLGGNYVVDALVLRNGANASLSIVREIIV